MPDRQLNPTNESQSMTSHEPAVEPESRFPQTAPGSTLAGLGGDAGSQTAVLHRTTGGKLARAGNTLLQMQQQHGNRHVQQVVNRALTVQAKLMLGDVDTPHEREADRVAAQAASGGPVTAGITPVRRGETAVSADVENDITQARGSGQPLADGARASLEQTLGADLGGVRVHTDSRAHNLNQSFRARAFTTGQDIFFRRGEYNPGTSAGQQLLAHEITHVMQQSQGSTAPAPVQRETFNQSTDDSELTYPVSFGDISQSLGAGKYRLTKQKTLYKTRSKSGGSWGTLAKGRLVNVLESASKGSDEWRSWAKVQARIGGDSGEVREGYVNTTSGLEDATTVLAHDKPNADTEDEGIIMPNPPTVNDVRQNMFGDCFLLAGLMALTRRNPRYVRRAGGLFVQDPSQAHERITVRLFHIIPYYYSEVTSADDFEEDRITVNNTILTIKQDLANTGNEPLKKGAVGSRGAQPWPAIVEKAFHIWPRKYHKDLLQGGLAETGLASLLGRPVERHGLGVSTSEVLPIMKEKYAEAYAKGDKSPEYKKAYKAVAEELKKNEAVAVKKKVKKALQDNQPITIGTTDYVPEEWKTRNPGQQGDKGKADEATWGGIVFGHAYEVVSANDRTITLHNPWQEFARVGGRVRKGRAQSVLTWDEFFIVASSLAIAQKPSD